MEDTARVRRLEALRRCLDEIPDRPERWKDALSILEAIAPEPSVIPSLVTALRAWDDRFFAVTLLGETRHRDAWAPLLGLVLDPRADSVADRAAWELAKVGGDAEHGELLVWLRAPQPPVVRERLLDALRSFGRPEGVEVIVGLWARGEVSLVTAAVKLAHMPVSPETFARWWSDEGSRALALTVLITMAAPTQRKPLAPALRPLVEAALAAPPRPLDRFDRARFEAWLAGAEGRA